MYPVMAYYYGAKPGHPIGQGRTSTVNWYVILLHIWFDLNQHTDYFPLVNLLSHDVLSACNVGVEPKPRYALRYAETLSHIPAASRRGRVGVTPCRIIDYTRPRVEGDCLPGVGRS